MTIKFDVKKDKNNNIIFLTNAKGNDVIRAPLLNKGTAFSESERIYLNLDGLLPPHILSIERQIEKILLRYKGLSVCKEILQKLKNITKEDLKLLKKTNDVTSFNFLRDLHDRNEILFYAFCYKYLESVLPIIYTPTVGDAVIRYSRDAARFRGIFLSPINIKSIQTIFDHFRFKRPTICVVTDNQGILGLGDQGVGGIDIPIGKLSLYVLGAGICPWETMPITLDVGTDNPNDLTDPYYLGYKNIRLTGEEYESFIDKFVNGIKNKYPNILIQWEDFSRQNAFTILDKYKDKILSFNDDIQGTGSVCLSGILNALRLSKEELIDQKFVVYGAGAGGVGIARRIVACLQTKFNISKKKACEKIALLDSKGMINEEKKVANYKELFSKNKNFYKNWEVVDTSNITLLEVIKNFQPTTLIGTSGRARHFNKEIIENMCENSKRPIIFPLSNPTSKSEATPQEIYKYSKGKAIVATGSPFEPFKFNNKEFTIGQCNNFFIFPGVGLGAIMSKGKYISDTVFTEVAYTLSELTSEILIKKGTIYPSVKDIRNISANIALKTINQISIEQGTEELSIDEIKSKMWNPTYSPIISIN